MQIFNAKAIRNGIIEKQLRWFDHVKVTKDARVKKKHKKTKKNI